MLVSGRNAFSDSILNSSLHYAKLMWIQKWFQSYTLPFFHVLYSWKSVSWCGKRLKGKSDWNDSTSQHTSNKEVIAWFIWCMLTLTNNVLASVQGHFFRKDDNHLLSPSHCLTAFPSSTLQAQRVRYTFQQLGQPDEAHCATWFLSNHLAFCFPKRKTDSSTVYYVQDGVIDASAHLIRAEGSSEVEEEEKKENLPTTSLFSHV